MRAINAGLLLLVFALGFFATDNLRVLRLQRIMFDKMLTNMNMDMIVTDVLDSAIIGIDETGEAVLSEKKADVTYEWLVQRNIDVCAADRTAFMLFTDAGVAEALEAEASAQIKTVNKRLNYSFLFTEETNSFLYNQTVGNSIYIMFLPKVSNMLRLEHNDIVYTLSGAKLE